MRSSFGVLSPKDVWRSPDVEFPNETQEYGSVKISFVAVRGLVPKIEVQVIRERTPFSGTPSSQRDLLNRLTKKGSEFSICPTFL